MKHWWEIATPQAPEAPKLRAVAYYRHSAQDRQENSIPLQKEQVSEFAQEHGIEIIKEFADEGKSGLNVEGRPIRKTGNPGRYRAIPAAEPVTCKILTAKGNRTICGNGWQRCPGSRCSIARPLAREHRR